MASPFPPNPLDPGPKKPPPKKAPPKGGGTSGGGAFGGGGGAPPPPPPQAKKNEQAQYMAWAAKTGIPKQTAADMWYWAGVYNPGQSKTQFAYYWTAVLKLESGGHHTVKGKLNSSGQAVGVGQIATSWIGQQIPWEPKGVVFTGDNDPQTGIGAYGVNLRFSGYLMAKAVSNYGYSGAYLQGYNPNDPNKQKAWAAIQQTLKTVPASVGPLAPSSGPGTGTGPGGSQGTQSGTSDPYVIGVSKAGKVLVAADIGQPTPKNTIQFDGTPVRLSTWQALARSLESYFVSYTGGRPNNNTILTYIRKGWTPYHLTIVLSQNKNFTNSPIYKANAASLQEAAKSVLPEGTPLPLDLIRSAVVNSWSPSQLQAVLRKQPGYIHSTEFQSNTATLMNTHASIMGTPDQNGIASIKQAALAGWDTTQYAAWLRAQPTYTQSPEYQNKTLTFLEQLGLITGQHAVLEKGHSALPNTNVDTEALPSDKRLLPAPALAPAEDTAAMPGT